MSPSYPFLYGQVQIPSLSPPPLALPYIPLFLKTYAPAPRCLGLPRSLIASTLIQMLLKGDKTQNNLTKPKISARPEKSKDISATSYLWKESCYREKDA